MRALLSIMLAAGCSFAHGTAGDPGSGGGGGGLGVDAADVMRPACDLSDPAVHLCLDFESADLGLDSSAGHHDATVVHASAMTRAAEQAVTVDATSAIHVDESSDLDITGAITVELWADPTQLPAAQDLALDNSGQYTIEVLGDGTARCAIAGASVDSKDPIPTGSWTHVGCTYDGAQLVIFIDGGVSACTSTSAPISTANTSGTTIGEPFVGGLDNVHVLSRAIAASEMCTHAGRSGCNTSCD